VLVDVSLKVAEKESIVIVGFSGCGKTTLLRVIAGLEMPDAGEITPFDKVVNVMSPSQCEVATVSQSYTLYPHLTVFKDLELALQSSRLGSGIPRHRVSGSGHWSTSTT
jgi:ABC-type sugar transport system ATPase subunit